MIELKLRTDCYQRSMRHLLWLVDPAFNSRGPVLQQQQVSCCMYGMTCLPVYELNYG